MPTPGLLYVGASIKGHALDEATFDKWYNEVHIPDVLSLPNGPPAAFRYKNANPSAPFPFLALYVLPDVDFVTSEELANAEWRLDGLPADRTHLEEACDFDRRQYEKIQTFEGQIPREGRAAKCIIAVAMEPADGAEAEKDFDAWYRLQHLDMLSTISGYRRSTRYKLMASPTADAAGTLDEMPRYLALHEYESTDVPPEQIKLAVGTEWSKKVIGGAKAFVRDIWVLVHEGGDGTTKL
ncbi:Alpha beta hydrolase fold protein [Neofusicoccum parvum]|uniref:Alpha beta hydrolase fold protein n=2 Tax=Neofusicoccum parvum TaxID=310453 RepID=A0ACB5SQ85_9PEZI|nr:putative alpha beta protein [Neofusicoccum parvum UCRNP2]GME36277.1 Alpha beta hydrolase fold protein [Neofusicoccum parvum]GME52810.1 Alpha beta hydrolase fold protein [Neofusicoccum parvum]